MEEKNTAPPPNIITSLVASTRRKERVNVYVDGEFAVQVHLDIVAKHELRKGLHVDSALMESLRDEKRTMQVKQLALAYATYKPRTEKQVRTRLREKECEAAEIDTAVVFLRDFGYVNDAQYAILYVRDAVRRKPVSAAKLRRDLRTKGVGDDEIERALRDEFPHDEVMMLARTAADKKLRAVSFKPIEKQKTSVR
ncbi:MAG: RecX family transcriptional regulator, partial [Candidatus Kapabacteria bacterium]|nr:RecX family transcriptional regulator [Candidatus Kapabacteria bacterium]